MRVSTKYIFITFIAVFFTWLLHEFTHWTVGELLGYKMALTLNTSYTKSGYYLQNWHDSLISIAGPIITLLEAVVCYFLLNRSPNQYLFPFLLTCFYMRLLAGILSFINLNDEARVGKALGLGPFILPALITSILFYLTYNIVKSKAIKRNLFIPTILLIIFTSSMIIVADMMWKVLII